MPKGSAQTLTDAEDHLRNSPWTRGVSQLQGLPRDPVHVPPAPISPDPESTRQLQQFLNGESCAGEVGSRDAVMGAGLAEEAASGGTTTLADSEGWERKEPMLRNSA